MWNELCRAFYLWCHCIKTCCLLRPVIKMCSLSLVNHAMTVLQSMSYNNPPGHPRKPGGTLCVSDTGDDLASLIRTHLKVTLRHRNEKCVTSYQSKQLSQQTTPECVMWLPTLSAPRWLDCFTLLLVRHLADVSCFLAKDVEQTTRWSKVKLLHC